MSGDDTLNDRVVQLFVDTNAFIQLRDLKDLPWRELFPKETQIDILVSQTVIDELDNLKTSSNERRRNRARLALKMIDAASVATDFRLTLPHRAIDLQLVIARGPLPDWGMLPKLDRNRADDQLIAEVIAFGRNASLLSHDTGPRIRARIIGISAHEPPASWLLPDEQTDDQRKISRLERMLKDALSDRPEILAYFGALEAPRETFEFAIPLLQPLPEEIRRKLVEAYFELHPPKRWEERRHDLNESFWCSIKGDTATSYNLKLDQFEKDVERYFADLHRTVFYAGRVVPVAYVVKNDSGIAAQGLRIEMAVDGDASMFMDQDDATAFFDVTSPPQLPVPTPDPGPFGYFDAVNRFNRHLNTPHDPTTFYWVTKPKCGVAKGALQCADYRATRVWEDHIWICPKDSQPCTITIEVSATNLPVPVAGSASISVEAKKLQWSSETAMALLPGAIRSLLKAMI